MQTAERQRELFKVAQQQGGYTRRTSEITMWVPGTGFASNRRIYRLALFPAPDRPDLILWWLWSRGRDDRPAGVSSYRTALSLHDLTDVNPSKIDLTVPPAFRKGSAKGARYDP